MSMEDGFRRPILKQAVWVQLNWKNSLTYSTMRQSSKCDKISQPADVFQSRETRWLKWSSSIRRYSMNELRSSVTSSRTILWNAPISCLLAIQPLTQKRRFPLLMRAFSSPSKSINERTPRNIAPCIRTLMRYYKIKLELAVEQKPLMTGKTTAQD